MPRMTLARSAAKSASAIVPLRTSSRGSHVSKTVGRLIASHSCGSIVGFLGLCKRKLFCGGLCPSCSCMPRPPLRERAGGLCGRGWRGGRGGLGRLGVFDVFGEPYQVVALEPLADGALHADVVAGVAGAVPLVLENLVALLEEEWPDFGFGDVRWSFGGGALSVGVLVLVEDRDGELQKLGDFGGELDGGGGLGRALSRTLAASVAVGGGACGKAETLKAES